MDNEKKQMEQNEKVVTDKIITIGRQLGSGGREIGQRLSEILQIPVYDKEILTEAAKKSGFTKEIFERNDEKPTNSFLYSLAMGVAGCTAGYQRPLVMELYLAQFETIRKLADQGPCIFIGRCSDYVLNDRKNVINVFVHADMDTRVERTMEKHGLMKKEAEGMCLRNDKDRSNYYNYYSNHQWGDAKYYDLCINTGKIGIDRAVDMIIRAVR
ncbi:MAG: AAA family ATPase [Lachnospiraceae bacterium]